MSFFDALFNYEFVQNAYLIGIIIGFIAPIMGGYVVVKRLSLIVEGISHVSMAGISFSLFLSKTMAINVDPIFAGIVFSLIGTGLIEKIRVTFKNYSEIGIPILISLSTALMIVFASLSGGFNQDFASFMFGNILTTTRTQVYITLIIFISFMSIGLLKHREMLAYAIDEDYCKFVGINTKRYKLFFNIFIAIVISISIKIVGMLLVSSLVVIPISSGSKVGKSFKQTLLFGVIFSEISVIGGLIMSFYLNIPSGATIVLINILIFGICMIIDKRRG